jgi:hypothetical protein
MKFYFEADWAMINNDAVDTEVALVATEVKEGSDEEFAHQKKMMKK